MSHATVLLSPHSRWLVVRVKRAADAAAQGPVDVVVTSEGRTVLKARLEASAVAEGYVPVNVGDRNMLFEMTARSPAPMARLNPFTSDSGVLIAWDFVEYVGEVRQYSALRGGERQ